MEEIDVIISYSRGIHPNPLPRTSQTDRQIYIYMYIYKYIHKQIPHYVRYLGTYIHKHTNRQTYTHTTSPRFLGSHNYIQSYSPTKNHTIHIYTKPQSRIPIHWFSLSLIIYVGMYRMYMELMYVPRYVNARQLVDQQIDYLQDVTIQYATLRYDYSLHHTSIHQAFIKHQATTFVDRYPHPQNLIIYYYLLVIRSVERNLFPESILGRGGGWRWHAIHNPRQG